MLQLVRYLIFVRERAAQDDSGSCFERTEKGDEILRNVGQDECHTIPFFDAFSLQSVGKSIAEVIEFTITNLLTKEDEGRAAWKRVCRIANEVLQRLFRLWNLVRHIIVVVLQPQHLVMLGCMRIGCGELRSYSMYKTTNGAIDGIGAFELYEVRGDGDDDILRAWDAAWDSFIILA